MARYDATGYRRARTALSSMAGCAHAYADALRFLAGEADRLADALDEPGAWDELVAAQRAWGRAADDLMRARNLARLATADTVTRL